MGRGRASSHVAPAPWYRQTFEYASTAELLQVAGVNTLGNRWRQNAITDLGGGYAGTITLETQNTYLGMKAMRLAFPNAGPFPAARLQNFSLSRDLFTDDLDFASKTHLCIEVATCYSANYSTIPNPEWGGGSVDEKSVLLFGQGGQRWELKMGFGNTGGQSSVRVGDPVNGQSLTPNRVAFPAPAAVANTYWVGQWFRTRMEISRGSTSVFRVWLENPASPGTFTKLHEDTGLGDLTAAGFAFETLRLGCAPRNVGADGPMTKDISEITIYDSNPGWL